MIDNDRSGDRQDDLAEHADPERGGGDLKVAPPVVADVDAVAEGPSGSSGAHGADKPNATGIYKRATGYEDQEFGHTFHPRRGIGLR